MSSSDFNFPVLWVSQSSYVKSFIPPSLLLDLIDFIFTNLWYNFGKWWKDLYFSLLKLRMVYLQAASDLSNHWFFLLGMFDLSLYWTEFIPQGQNTTPQQWDFNIGSDPGQWIRYHAPKLYIEIINGLGFVLWLTGSFLPLPLRSLRKNKIKTTAKF